MRLITFQSMDAVRALFQLGYLQCDEQYVNPGKYAFVYDWVIAKMADRIKNTTTAKYPLWAWVRCYNHICPPKRKGKRVPSFDVKITFHKDEEDVFITDFRRYSFVLNNTYIPETMEDKERFDRKPEEHRIRESFDRCITKDSDILQGCVWNILLKEVEKIEILPDDGYRYGSLNYIRSNGKRMNWRKDFYNKLKEGK